MKFGYARVSKLEQNLDRQIDQLIEQGIHKANIYTEKITGTKRSRPQLDKLLQVIQPGDAIVVTELTRISRSTRNLINLSEELKLKKVELISLKENIDTTTATGKMLFGMFSVLSQFERDLISERTKEGLKAARARGKNGGRPTIPKERIDTALLMYKMDPPVRIKDICTMTGISKATLYKYLKKENDNTVSSS